MTVRKISHYELQDQLGEGGMGRVFRALDVVLHRPVAIKLLTLKTASDPSFVERFRREARLAAQLNHPNIATIYEFGEEGGEAYLAMELVEGETIGEMLRRGPFPVSEVRRLGIQMARALAAAHARGIVHRDIKAANLMLTPEGDLKVMDFGVARSLGETQLTVAGSLVGTAHIMAPEIIQGHQAGPEADLFSMGCVLFEMLSGAPPFHGDDAMGVLFRIVNNAPVPLSEYRQDVPPDVLGVVEGLLEKDPAQRFGPASAVAEALAENGAPPPAPADATMIVDADATMIVDGGSGISAPTGQMPVSRVTAPGGSGATAAPTGVAPGTGVATPGATGTMTAAGASAGGNPLRKLLLFGLPALVILGLFIVWIATRGDDGPAPTAARQENSPERLEAIRLNDEGTGILLGILNSADPSQASPDSIAEARRLFQTATQKDPSLFTPWNNLAQLLRVTDNLDQAVVLFQSAVTRDSTTAPIRFNFAYVLEEEGRLDEAIGHYRAAVRLDSTEARYPNNLSYALVRKGLDYEALEVLTFALRRFPEVKQLHKNKGLAHLEIGDAFNLEQAEGAFAGALALDPGYVDALVGLARTAEGRNDASLARDRWNTVLQNATGPTAEEARRALDRL